MTQILARSSVLCLCAALATSALPQPQGSPLKDPGPLETLLLQGSIPELQAAMDEGRLTAEALTRFFLERIKDHDGPLQAVIATNPEALAQARRLDQERKLGQSRGPLHGIPLLLKDNIEMRELPTTAGSLALANNLSGRDAPVVANLRAAGAVLLGKTNLSEWANFRSERSSSGWSAVGGQTRNPWDTGRSPCGSSSGSGVAVAAGFCVAALGTETDGSVICPSSVNGITGLKPSIGLCSRTGIVPISHSQDTAGPMTRTPGDAALVLQAMRGEDARDPVTARGSGVPAISHPSGDPALLRGARIGVLRSATGYHEGVDSLFDQALECLRGAGAILLDGLGLEEPTGFGDDSYHVLLCEFKHDLNQYLGALPDSLPVHTLAGLIQFNLDHTRDEMPWFGQEIFVKSQATGGLEDPGYPGALERVRSATREHGLDSLLTQYSLDALLAPTTGPAWSIDLVTGDHFLGGFSSYPAIAGYPHLSLPMGLVHGLPVGLSLSAGEFADARLLELGASLEALLRKQP
ncbi:MAG: amidase [Calditrichaeota bacterium]|nr:amidase [Calditrichota bacterium]MCB9472715.1 amidase [Candidatus Delongbacteria bacterium]